MSDKRPLNFAQALRMKAPAPRQEPAPSNELPASHELPARFEQPAGHPLPQRVVELPASQEPPPRLQPAPRLQPGGGYSRFTNEVTDQILRTLDPYSQCVLIQLLRLSWGNQNDTCKIGLPKLAERCGFSEDAARKAKKNLVARRIVEILEEDNNNLNQAMRGTLYRILLSAPPLRLQGGSQQRPPRFDLPPSQQLPNKENTQKENTQTQDAPPATVAPGVGVGSRFTIEECRRYAKHLQSTGQGITNPGGYATTIKRTGEADELIAAFLSPASDAPPSDFSLCPDCQGSGFYYPNGINSGVAKCKHENLQRGSEASKISTNHST